MLKKVSWLQEDRPPWSYWAYVIGVASLVGLSFLPSEVRTSYSVPGALIEVALLVALYFGSSLSRWLLIALGVFAGAGTFLLQTTSLDPVATGWSVLAWAVTGLLLTPSMSRHTSRSTKVATTSEQGTP